MPSCSAGAHDVRNSLRRSLTSLHFLPPLALPDSAEIQEKKREVDERNLQLQNLLYEKNHLQRTIQGLRDFPLRELNAIASDEGVPVLVKRDDDLFPPEVHRDKVETLKREREERVKLHEEHLEAQSRKAALSEELAKQREHLDVEIPRQIEELVAVSKAVQSKVPGLQVASASAADKPVTPSSVASMTTTMTANNNHS